MLLDFKGIIEPLNTKHVITTLGHTQSVTLHIYITKIQLVLQTDSTGLHN